MTIDPELAPFVEATNAAWPRSPITVPVPEWRRKVEEMADAARPPRPEGLTVTDRTIPGRTGRSVGLRIYRPEGAGPFPALIYFHGGGWTVGSINSHDIVTATLAAETPAVVISVDYARAPENPFPAAFEDAADALEWVSAEAGALGIRPGTIAVGGDSAGGNLSAALALAYRDAPQRVAGQLLFYPCVDVDFTTRSYVEEAEAPFLKSAEMIWFWDQYCPTPELREDYRAVPMRAESHADLPPALIIAAEHDPLRQDAHGYAAKLTAAGSPVTLRPGRGLIHGFLRAKAICRAAAEEYAAAEDWLRRLPPAQSTNGETHG